MTDTNTVAMTREEAWAILDALAQANRNAPDGIETQRRSWMAQRILRLFPATAPAPATRTDNVEYHRGIEDAKAGKTLDSNPYTAGGERADRWDLGWRSTQQVDNPIPFNPESLTVRQAKEGLELLRDTIAGLQRFDRGEIDVNNLLHNVRQRVAGLNRDWFA